MHNHGELFVNFMRARREVFIQSKGWDLPEVDGMEFDQYDTPRARWIVLHEYGEVLGGVRLTPTTSQCGQYSYMIRDAQQGLIDTIPRDVLFFKAPVNPTVWEATRLFLAPSIPSQRRMELQRLLLARMATAAAEMNASHVIGIVPAVFSRWMTRLGVMSAVPVGPVLNIDGDRTQAALMRAVPDEQVN
ncbi:MULTISPECIES: acyl-homoserine-lactone synthase [unclassified Sulfitobacter]|uniref:acyl-homoserine-lactone synthase n=1 Tax=unclassified Sulfitobacter TaxID=196795 RepID=UPI001EEF94C6|nr:MULTISPECIES: acyl-homoserine-lactone synthase [unclassified Sulfitobacter]